MSSSWINPVSANGSLIQATANSETTTASSGSTITLTNVSLPIQIITGSAAQTIVLPLASSMVIGQFFEIVNQSSASISLETSSNAALATINAGFSFVVTCQLLSGTTTASWSYKANLNYTTGTLAIGGGGTGTTSAPTQYGAIYASSTTAFGSTAAGTAAYPLVANSSAAPTFQQLDLTAGVVNALPVANGGTGMASTTQYGVIYASSGSALASTAAGTSGYVLTSNGTSAPTFQAASSSGISFTSQALSGTPIVMDGTYATSQLFTGTNQSQTITLPTSSAGLTTGVIYKMYNRATGTGVVSVNASTGATLLATVNPGNALNFLCLSGSGASTAANWAVV